MAGFNFLVNSSLPILYPIKMFSSFYSGYYIRRMERPVGVEPTIIDFADLSPADEDRTHIIQKTSKYIHMLSFVFLDSNQLYD